MPHYSQNTRPFRIDTVLQPDALLLASFAGMEQISQPFAFQVSMLAEAPVPFQKLMGSPATVSGTLADGSQRTWNGVIRRLGQGGVVSGSQGGVTFFTYRAEIVPRLALLDLRTNSRIFQQMTVPEILGKILKGEHGLDLAIELQGTYHARDYCTQYRETDLDFVSRLMEEEGIFYFFRHTADKHTLVLADTPQSHTETVSPRIRYETTRGANMQSERIHAWFKEQILRARGTTLWDHSFELPGQTLEAKRPLQESAAAGAVKHELGAGSSALYERYDYPGGYAQRFDGVNPGGGDRAADLGKIHEDNKRTAGIRMQQEAAHSLSIRGESNCRQLCAGHRFKLDDHFDGDGDYVLTSVAHRGEFRQWYLQDSAGEATSYANEFVCIPASLPYRPERVTPKPVIAGTQTAEVVGLAGEEIFTDKYGRIKVQFPWDREGKKDADSSCWVRVSQVHAGKRWGGIDVPRVGEEVVIAYEEGDPDRPIAVGRVYNAGQMPPFELPKKKMVSGLKSNTYPGGGGDNEISMDDSKGSERMYIHAQFNQDEVVEHDQTHHVKNNRTKTIDVDETTTIGNNRSEHVKANEDVTVDVNRKHTVGANHTEAIGANMSRTVGGMKNEAVGMTSTESVALAKALSVGAAYAITVGAAMNVAVGAAAFEEVGMTKKIIVGDKLEIVCGSARLVMESGGKVTIEGTEFLFAASGDVKINGSVIDLN